MSKGDTYAVLKPDASEYPEVEGTRCVQVHIPDDISYLPVLAAAVAALGNTWSSIGSVEQRRAWSRRWQDAYAATDWENCMDCERVLACIEENEAVKEAIRRLADGQNKFPPDYPLGEELPLSRQSQELGSQWNNGCDLNVLWAQCRGVIDLTDDFITDTLEVIEVSTNVVELAKNAIAIIPLINAAYKLSGLEAATDMINY